MISRIPFKILLETSRIFKNRTLDELVSGAESIVVEGEKALNLLI